MVIQPSVDGVQQKLRELGHANQKRKYAARLVEEASKTRGLLADDRDEALIEHRRCHDGRRGKKGIYSPVDGCFALASRGRLGKD